MGGDGGGGEEEEEEEEEGFGHEGRRGEDSGRYSRVVPFFLEGSERGCDLFFFLGRGCYLVANFSLY